MSSQLRPGRWASQIEHLTGFARRFLPRDDALWQVIIACGFACLVIFLTFYHLDLSPSPDKLAGIFDDAVHLLAAKTLALEGRYDFGPAIGPTVLLPVAAAMRIFGINHFSGHVAMALYLLLNVAAFYALARQLGDWKVSMGATLLYVIGPGIYLIYLGRMVMGDVPAVLFTLAGILVCFRALDEPRLDRQRAKLVLGGILLGLAILSKNQFLLLLPAWVTLWFLDHVYYRQAKHSYFLLTILSAILTVAGWYIAQWVLFPNGQQLATHNLSTWFDAPSRGIFTFSTRRISVAIRFLTDGGTLYALVLPAWLYAALRGLSRSKEGLRWATLVTVTTIWLGWFTFFSVAWFRYALLALTFSAVFVAHFFYDVTGGYRVPIDELVTSIRSGRRNIALMGSTVLLALFGILIARSLIGRLSEVLPRGCDSHQQMADYVMEHVPSDAPIETFNPEICLLAGRACLVPTGGIMDAALKYVYYGGPPPFNYYSPQAPYLVIGYATASFGIFDIRTVKSNYVLEMSTGDPSRSVENDVCRYDLYRIKQGN